MADNTTVPAPAPTSAPVPAQAKEEQSFKPNCKVTFYRINQDSTQPPVIFEFEAFALHNPKDLDVGFEKRYKTKVDNTPGSLELNREHTSKNSNDMAFYNLVVLAENLGHDVERTRFILPKKGSFEVFITGLRIYFEKKWNVVAGPHFDPKSNTIELLLCPTELKPIKYWDAPHR